MRPSLLSRHDTAILVIDPQEKLLPHVFEPRRVVGNTVLLIKLARILGLPVIATTQYARGIGPIVPRIRKELNNEPVLDKVEFGCFDNPGFVDYIKTLDGAADTLVVSGIESHICVAQTVLQAIDQGYRVHVASDAVSSRTKTNWQVGLDRMRLAGAVISSTEMVIFELLRKSDCIEFKKILPDLREPI